MVDVLKIPYLSSKQMAIKAKLIKQDVLNILYRTAGNEDYHYLPYSKQLDLSSKQFGLPIKATNSFKLDKQLPIKHV